jgi:hypothetical protein
MDDAVWNLRLDAEWQHLGDDEWVFGVKVRGIARDRLAELYFDPDSNNPRGGWFWMVYGPPATRGAATSLSAAVRAAEVAMGQPVKPPAKRRRSRARR